MTSHNATVQEGLANVTVLSIKNNKCDLNINDNLKSLLYENLPEEIRKRKKGELISHITNQVDKVVKVEKINVNTWLDQIVKLIDNPEKNGFNTETSFATFNDIYQIIYLIQEPSDNLNQIACYASLDHYPITSDAVIIKISQKDGHGSYDKKLVNCDMSDLTRIIRRRYYDNIILTYKKKYEKRSIHDLDYFCKFIFSGKITDELIEIIGIKLNVIYDAESNDEINEYATRFLKKIIKGPAIIKFNSNRQMLTNKQFNRLNVLAYEYSKEWNIDKTNELPELRLSKAIDQWKLIKNKCQICGNEFVKNNFYHGSLFNQRACSEKCLLDSVIN